ncbi:MAG: PAS domain-containing sensor histidine kinase [Reichenbachiella sp.]|uniref:PAS domain-containing sensor histidine kinase n=1 Tax=Reichenbachiella sp. TaxID=2184521 RepID=UPI0032677FFD
MALSKIFRSFINNGLRYGNSTLERRRIRLINIFNATGAIIVLTFFSINLIVGSIGHGFLVLSGLLIVTVPVVVLNSKGRTDIAKYYLTICALLFYNAVAYKSVFQLNNRDNGFFLIGFSTMIIALFDNPAKTIVFFLTAVSAVMVKYVRIVQFSVAGLENDIMSMVNLIIGFVCVYFFTDIFKIDLIKNEKRARSFAKKLERQKFLVQSERDELIYNKKLLRTTIDNLPVFITMMDTRGRFIIVNSSFEKALKLEIEEIEGKSYDEVLGSRVSRLAKPLFEKCLAGIDVEINHPIFFPSGEIIHAFGKYTPLVNNRGRVTHVLAFVTDIRKLKKTERKLREINASKDKILSILSHDLRGPLNSLSGLLDYSKDLDPSVFDKLMESIKNQVGTLNFTLDNVLSWVKTQLGGFSAHPKMVDPAKLVKNSLDLYHERFREKSIIVENELKEGRYVKIDPDHMDIVMRNLISNAIKFTPLGGKITIGAQQGKSQMKLSIKDSGVGMSNELITQIMAGINMEKPHTSPGTNGEKGTGLGLNFCNDILKLNHATMEIKSRPDEGTEVVICILTS